VIQYRTFRNTDPPALVDLWNDCFTGRGAAYLRGTILLEYFAFAKPYFDPNGLILAEAGNQVVGFVLAGFGPTADGAALDRHAGVVCLLGVAPAFRRQGIGSELLRRGEEYLRQQGAAELHAGPTGALNPYTFGIYGGSESSGFLESEPLARPFLERRGYRVHDTALVLQRSLETPLNVSDVRFVNHRSRYDIYAGPLKTKSWWRECVLGPVELHEYRLQDKNTSATVARLTLWEMETFGPRWNEHAIGMSDFEVVPELRRQGMGKFFLLQVLRHLHEQFFTLLEIHVRESDEAGLNLLRLFGFRQVDRGLAYRRDASS
jgi:ribosomal protein S18 acetylase RimI-like enzyme